MVISRGRKDMERSLIAGDIWTKSISTSKIKDTSPKENVS